MTKDITSYHPGSFTQRDSAPHLWTLTPSKHSSISSLQLIPVKPVGHWHWFGATQKPPFWHGCSQIAKDWNKDFKAYVISVNLRMIIFSDIETRRKSVFVLTFTFLSISGESIFANASILSRSSVFTFRIFVTWKAFFV